MAGWFLTVFAPLGGVAVGSPLAEGEEGGSEARPWRGSGVKPYDLDSVVNSQSETTNRRWRGWRRSCRSVVSARSALPHEVKVETVATWGGAINSRSVPYFYRL